VARAELEYVHRVGAPRRARARSHLPPTAIGKDYSGTKLVGPAPSGRGFQLSLFGLAGITASSVEGLEVNLLGLTFGVNPFDPALKLPLVGRIGASRASAASPGETASQRAG